MIKSVTIENKSMVSLHGLAPGKRAEIQVDQDGVPLDMHWRRRMKDALSDGCIAVVQQVEPKAKPAKKEAE